MYDANWLDIPGLPGYQLSADGFKVRSVDRISWHAKTEDYKYPDEIAEMREAVKIINPWICEQTYGLYRKSQKGRELKLYYPEDRIPYFTICGSHISMRQIQKAVRTGVPIKTPLKAPILVKLLT